MSINIGNLTIEHLEVHPPASAPLVPEASQDGAPSSVHVEYDDTEIDRLEAIDTETKRMISSRRIYLDQTIYEANKATGLKGFMVNHSREPDYRDAVEAAQLSNQDKAAESLARACGSCLLAATCRLAGDFSVWQKAHPAANKVTRRFEEPTNALKKRLDKDPMAHCDPKTLKPSEIVRKVA